ncbi:acetyl-CoA carboxylase biotin carboxylase subunit [Bacillus paralicheniformis]|uniref:acetyl-CoA carboxylase biotin carboxylase subunit n=1 Tax=Bacillus TaxID=1386 RepID=UPI0009A3B9DC|nr:acetyl-CoA carboxylase biotin carboxylase subunit [Bacillus paralicheniformis]MCB6216993.1 acetyl-CoA carboxylase biotin carboxylase subunit [Bacillus paralicheniformis]MDE1383938.1 acetyl-CoA carboxylase biotin carboxylase subunit [Bacillus paralicheniformis]MDW6053715.1 acetyl-CoA carboxylase biotin carboxylase subunit [Bacillus paralicheniformis]MEB3127909.1 acetyl-CoA carboxylase biotin carboxylase subunit [Bacillus paralicheniformis]MEC1825671.1 acetyl-CoA carboxylase biotin carboxylas
MFQKLLIANRGEIALRIIRTCKRLGIQTAAVYSEADAESLHVKAADEAWLIGKPRVSESYLNIEKIIETSKKAGVCAIHPGYGLLSENSRFAERCLQENITFIGPPADVIAKMGSKIEARQAMEQAGIPVVPGVTKSLAGLNEAKALAESIGYPVMLKASFGGGGIGMQLIRNESELAKAYEGSQKRAADFFGDGAMYIEKYIEDARHIEIQILTDEYGNAVYLWERDCSIQRRQQKIIEEAPAPLFDENMRAKLGEAAVKAALSIGYANAGTIEFLVDSKNHFYFLEMNTRLQVEHPVTEEITGLDIVEEQLNIAAGKALPYKQKDIRRDGHAIEVRICAEDPKTFFPSPGRITDLKLPEHPNVRHECAAAPGMNITPYYDPMIAKMIVKGNSRDEAIRTLAEALSQYQVKGIKTNIPLLEDIVRSDEFRKGGVQTDFISRYQSK